MVVDKSHREKAPKSSNRIWPDWYPELKIFRVSNRWKAVWQIMNTLIPYTGLWVVMVWLIEQEYSYLLILILSVPAGALLVRIFILFHDCVHGSFFKSRRMNTFWGYCLGVLVFTSYEDWRFCHLRHHAKYANLDTRGTGDIWTLTRKEYEASSRGVQLVYKLYRHPLILIGLGALFNFLLHNRLPTRRVKHKARMGVFLTNLLIIAAFLGAVQIMGWKTFVLIQLPVIWIAGAAGIWLFYVQHQFEKGYWARKDNWEPLRAAMDGSSFYKLPAVLRWFSGNIGYHHIHHLSPGIPNYHLKACFDAVPVLQKKEPLTIIKSLFCLRLKLWDETLQRMVGFP